MHNNNWFTPWLELSQSQTGQLVGAHHCRQSCTLLPGGLRAENIEKRHYFVIDVRFEHTLVLVFSILRTTSMPSSTLPKTTWRPSSQGVLTWKVNVNFRSNRTLRCFVYTRGAIQTYSADEELGSISVRSSIGHRQPSRTVVLQLEVLVFETVAIDRLAASSITTGEVTSYTQRLSPDLRRKPPRTCLGSWSLW